MSACNDPSSSAHLNAAVRPIIENLESRQLYAAHFADMPAALHGTGGTALHQDAAFAPSNPSDLGSLGNKSKKSLRGSLGGDDTEDFVRVNLTSNAAVKLKLSGLSEDCALELLDENGELVDDSDLADNLGESISGDLPAGTYYVRISHEDDEGTGTRYKLTVQTKKARGPLWSPPVTQAPPAGDNDGSTTGAGPDTGTNPPTGAQPVVRGELQEGDRTFSDQTFYDRYEFTAQRSGRVTILIAAGYAPYAELRDAANESVIVESNGQQASQIELTFDVQAGATYTLLCGSVLQVTGRYAIQFDAALANVRDENGSSAGDGTGGQTPNPNGGQPADPAAGLIVAGALEPSDAQLRDGTVGDIYVFTATATGTATIIMAGEGYAPRLYVFGSSNSSGPIAVNENANGEGAIQVEFEVVAGQQYAIVAGSVTPVLGRYAIQFSANLGSITDANGNPVGQAPSQPGGDRGTRRNQSSEFSITLQFDSAVSPQVRQAFEQAAERWSSIIVGDLPDARLGNGQVIDDILITVSVENIDGVNGTLGQAAVRDVREDSLLPYSGLMEFDAADMNAMLRDGSLSEVIFHEMAHVLGHGSLWEDMGLIRGAGTNNPLFVGRHAVAEFSQLFGQSVIGVPVEEDGGPGTAGSHWDEEFFGNELLTGYHNEGVLNPLSRVSIASFEDMGYEVNYDAADAYALPSAALQNLRVSPFLR